MSSFKLSLPVQSISYTDEQMNIATNQSDRIAVRALAGTGKTETVALRVREQLARGVRAENIFVATFTKAARDQIEKRLRGSGIKGVRVKTLHATAYGVLRRATGAAFELSNGQSYMMRALSLKHHEASLFMAHMMFEAMRRGKTASGYAIPESVSMKASQVRDVIGLYQRLKEEDHAIDYDDLFAFAGSIIDKSFDEVIVDEAQDLTVEQFRFAEGLARRRLVLVGDGNQAIFGWNGADGSALDLGDVCGLSLSESFRSSPEILRVAERLITETFRTNQEAGEVRFRRAIEDHDTAIVDAVRDGARCVLARTKSELAHWSNSIEASGFSVDRSWKLDSERNKDADVIAQTIHSAKGSEWNHVVMGGIGAEGFRASAGLEHEDQRLLYVSATRARRQFDVVYYDGLPFGWARYASNG